VRGSLRRATKATTSKPMTVRRRGRGSHSVFRVLLVDHVGELAEVGIQGGKQPSEGVPTHIKSPCLGVGDVRLACACPSRDFLLRKPGLNTQCAERSSKDEPVFVGVGHVSGRSIVRKSQIGTCQVRRVRVVCRQHKIVAPALLEQPGAVAPRVQASRCAGHATNVWIVASSPRVDLTAPSRIP
jgi:hypothetical protein